MTRILLPDETVQRRLVFYLAMEEYLARETSVRDAVFFWKVAPTVIFGRNQVMAAEVNIPWCREHGVQMYRRKSGGGCVYSDSGNLMISCITSGTDVMMIFERYLNLLAMALRRLGVNAMVTGRNDISIDGKKVSGNAYQLLPECSIVHGTLLFDSDLDALEHAVTPSDTKLRSKGVSSVRQHVVNLKSVLGRKAADMGVCDIDSLAGYLASTLCNGTLTLDSEAVARIEEIERTYLDPEFIRGRDPRSSVTATARFEGVGEITAEAVTKAGKFESVHLSGDFFSTVPPAELDRVLDSALAGVELRSDDVINALSSAHFPGIFIPGLTPEEFFSKLLTFCQQNS